MGISDKEYRVTKIDELIRDTLTSYQDNNAGQMAAALAFYVLLSILPLMLFTLTSLGIVLGEEVAGAGIYRFLVVLTGPSTARTVQEFVLAAGSLNAGWGLSVVSVVILLFSASSMFHHLRRSLDKIWDFSDTRKPVRSLLLGRWFSMLFTLVIDVLLIALIFLQTLITTVLSVADQLLPVLSGTILRLSDPLLSFFIIFLFIALIFRLLPGGSLPWSTIWRGATSTALLLLIGQIFFSLFLRYRFIATLYGAAGSLLVGMLGVFYSTHIFYLCVAFTGAVHRSLTR